MKPIILREYSYKEQDVIELKKKNKIWLEKDIYKDQLRELFQITYPHVLHTIAYNQKWAYFIECRINPNINERGDWIYFPWSGILLHAVNEKDYQKLRTNRNQYLITQSEQRLLYQIVVGIVGLSVGSQIAVNLSKQGIGKKLKLAEFDVIETTNLNRVHSSLINIKNKKIESTAKSVWEINPYSELYLFTAGLNDHNLNVFFGNPKPDMIFEVIDDFKMKVKLRLIARKKCIPVVMFSNVGNTIIIDIERFDLFPSLSLFNNLLGDLPQRILKDKNINANTYAVQMVGKKFISKRASQSVKDIGKRLIGRPQINGTETISSGLSSYIIKAIICDKSRINGRYVLNIGEVFNQSDI